MCGPFSQAGHKCGCPSGGNAFGAARRSLVNHAEVPPERPPAGHLCHPRRRGAAGPALKSRLSSHYDERIDPQSFYGALEALVDGGFVDARTEGIHDVYALTDAGRARLREHYAWLGEQLDES